MTRFSLIVLVAASVCAAQAETIYYATSGGKQYEKKTWHTGDLARFKATQPDDVFDSYTFQRLPDGSSRVFRDYATPSGDWLLSLIYQFAKNGRLTHLQSEFVTFGGVTALNAGGGLTRCVRSYTVSRNGTLQKTSEEITDGKTGHRVSRTFWEPQLTHWKHLSELPIRPKTS